MCKHRITKYVAAQDMRRSLRAVDPALVSRSYDAHSPALHGVLLEVLGCKACAEAVVEHAFVRYFTEHAVEPRCHQLLSMAFSCCCAGAGDGGRASMQARIRSWFAGAPARGGSWGTDGTDPTSAMHDTAAGN
ncbi:MAG: hypothetical protein IPO05_13580 [Flavobacteriales bacterium]|nr:hypothetical protein [Flavobacteriales bacterium]